MLATNILVRGTTFLGLALSGAACSDSGPASEGEARLPVEPISGGSAVMLYCAGLDALAVDPRDAGLRRVLSLFDERLHELSADVGATAPPDAIELLFELLRSPFCLSVDAVEAGGATQVPFRVQLSVRTETAAQADALAARFAAILPLASTPAEGRPGLAFVDLPPGQLFFGRSKEGDAFVVALGEPSSRWPDPRSFELPAGVEPVLALGLDMHELRGPLELLLALDESTAMVRKQLEWSGLLGEDPLVLGFAVGHATDRSRWMSRVSGWVNAARTSGALAPAPLTREELRLVPADATLASVTKLDPRMFLSLIESVSEVAGEDLVQLTAPLGIELGADVLEPLGETIGFYLSDTTGGGGLASAVAFVSVDDEARLGATLAKLTGTLEEWAGRELDGRVRVRAFEHDGTRCLGLAFPGLPVPLEPSLALARGRLFAGATPQALVAALEHAESGAEGLLAHPGLRANGLGSLDDLQGLSFSDNPRLLRDGYSIATLLFSALANAVRSPADASRDPGLVLPPYRELLAGARPMLQVTRIEGDDLVTSGEGDRSAVASLTALLGWWPSLVSGMVVPGVLATLVVPNVVRTLVVAEEAKAKADIVAIHSVLVGYAIENEGRYPDSLEALVTPDESGHTLLDSDSIPRDPWGNEYLYEPPVEGRSKMRLYTLGSDGLVGGEGDARDMDYTDIRDGRR